MSTGIALYSQCVYVFFVHSFGASSSQTSYSKGCLSAECHPANAARILNVRLCIDSDERLWVFPYPVHCLVFIACISSAHTVGSVSDHHVQKRKGTGLQ